MFKNLQQLITFLVFLHKVFSAQIYSTNIQVFKPTAGFATNYQFSFRLSTPINSDEYLRVTFPYQLHSVNGALDVSCTLSLKTEPSFTPITVSTITSNENTYHFNFGIPLKADIWYTISIDGQVDKVRGQTSGLKNPIQLKTVSSISSTSFVFDENLSFGGFALAEYPQKTMKLEIVHINPLIGDLQLGAQYPIKILIYNQQNITLTQGQPAGTTTAIIDLEFKIKQIYLFVNDNQCSTNASTCICKFPGPLGNFSSFQVICSHPFQVNQGTYTQPIAVTITVANPSFVSSATTLIAYTTNNQDQKVVESGISTSSFYTTSINLINLSLFLLSDIPYLDSVGRSLKGDYGLPITLYAPKAPTPYFQPFNDVRFQFQVDTNTPVGKPLRVLVYLAESEAVLQGSIFNNLPSIISTSDRVVCYFQKDQLSLQCDNVGQLLTATNYTITAKIAFTSSAKTIQINFGAILIQVDYTNLIPTQVSVGKAAYQYVELTQTDDYVDITGFHSKKAFGLNQVVTAPAAPDFATALNQPLSNGSTIGIVPSTTTQRLIFYLKVTSNQMCPSIDSLCGAAMAPDIYLRMIFNHKAVKIADSEVLKGIELNGVCTTGAVTNCKYYNTLDGVQLNKIEKFIDSSANQLFSYVNFKCMNGLSTCSVLLSGTSKAFGLTSVTFSSGFQSSIYPSDNNLDFVLGFSYAAAGMSYKYSTVASMQIIHGYTISGSLPSNIKASYINWMGQAAVDVTNQGITVPSLLRIQGIMSAAELAGQTAPFLAVFFSQNVQGFFCPSLKDFSYSKVAEGSNYKCQLNNAQSNLAFGNQDDWTQQSFVLVFDLALASSFELIIGVTFKSMSRPKTLNLGILSQDLNGKWVVANTIRVYGSAINVPIFTTSPTFYDDFVTLNWNTAAWDSVSDYNNVQATNNVVASYSIQNAGTIFQPNKVITVSGSGGLLFSASHTDVGNLISVNSGTLNGAGFMICAQKINYFSGAAVGSWAGGSTCQFMKYFVISKGVDNYCYYCSYDSGTYTDGSGTSGVIIDNFKVPFYWGALYSLQGTFYYSWSNQHGQLMAVNAETSSTGASSKGLLCQGTNWTPLLRKNTERQRISFSVTPSNLITMQQNNVFTAELTLDALNQGLQPLSYCAFYESSNPSQSSLFQCSYTTSGAANQIISYIVIYLGSGTFSLQPTLTYTFSFLISHSGTAITSQSFTVKLYWAYTVLIDDCTAAGSYQAGSSSATVVTQSDMQINNLVFECPQQLCSTVISWEFSTGGSEMIPSGSFLFNMGFLSSPNANLLPNWNCRIYEGSTISHKFANFVPNVARKQFSFQLKSNLDSYASTNFLTRCAGAKTPNLANVDSFVGYFIDSSNGGQILQTSNSIRYYNYFFGASSQFANNSLQLVNKFYNAPRYEAIYQFRIVSSKVNFLSTSRIYVEFSASMLPLLSDSGSDPGCSINGYKVSCQIDPAYQRRVIVSAISNKISKLEPFSKILLEIAGIVQPINLDEYGQIWVALDVDSDPKNGINEQGDVYDQSVQTSAISLLPQGSSRSNTLEARSDHLMIDFNFTADIRTIVGGNLAFVYLPTAFRNRDLFRNLPLQCNLYRKNDKRRVNLTTTCEPNKYNSYIKMRLNTDNANLVSAGAYIANVFFLRSPDFSTDLNFPLQVGFFITDPEQKVILYQISSNGAENQNLAFQYSPWQNTLMWSIQSQQNTLQTNQAGVEKVNYIQVLRGYYLKSTKIALSLSVPFNRTFSFYFFDDTYCKSIIDFYAKEVVVSFSKRYFQIEIGETSFGMKIAGKSSINPGVYSLEMKKSGDNQPFTEDIVSEIPVLQIEILPQICQITLPTSQFNIPQQGKSIPLFISLGDCVPSDLIIISAKLPTNDNALRLFGFDRYALGQNHQKGALFQLQSTANSVVGEVTTLSLAISGENFRSFAFSGGLNTVSFQVSPFSASIHPEALPISIMQYQNDFVQLSLSCSQASTILWALAINEASGQTAEKSFVKPILALEILQKASKDSLENQIDLRDIYISQINKLYYSSLANRYDPYLLRTYGYLYAQDSSILYLNFTNLLPDQEFSFIYYCQNQYDFVSKPVYSNFQGQSSTLDQRNYKLSLEFNSTLETSEQNDLQCSLIEYFSLLKIFFTDINCQVCDFSKRTAHNYQLTKNYLTACPQVDKQQKKMVDFYIWSGFNLQKTFLEVGTYIPTKLDANPCLVYKAVQDTQVKSIIEGFTGNYTLTEFLASDYKILPVLVTKKFKFVQKGAQITLQLNNSEGLVYYGYYESSDITVSVSNPVGCQLRKGIMGDNTPLTQLFSPIFTDKETPLVLNITGFKQGNKYSIYWTAGLSNQNCLSQHYSQVMVRQAVFNGPDADFQQILHFYIATLTLLISAFMH